MSSFSPVIRVRKLLEKIKSERSSPRLKRFPSISRNTSEEARDSTSSSYPEIPSFKNRKAIKLYNGDNQFNTLPPEAALQIFSFLDSVDLCRIGQVSKDMFAYAEDELTWKNLTIFDWGIDVPFASTWKESYALLEDLCADGVWEGMSKWIEPVGFDNEQKTTARLHFIKRSKGRQPITPTRSSPTPVHRVDSQSTTAPVSRSTSAVASHRDAPHRIVGSGVTVNCTTPSPFKIEGQRTIMDATGRTFEWNKQFEKHTSVYSGQMDFPSRSVQGTIEYNDGSTHWKGIFNYTKSRCNGSKLVMA